MTVVIAPDSYKGVLSAQEAAETIQKALQEEMPEETCLLCPMADGGAGTLEALAYQTDIRLTKAQVLGPYYHPVEALWGEWPEKAVVEMAQVAGWNCPRKGAFVSVRYATTFGLGELLKHVWRQESCREIYLCLGGSVTNDGGLGMARALGVRFWDSQKRELFTSFPYDVWDLTRLAHIELPDHLKPSSVTVHALTDVQNPLCGPEGASAVYGPQKGVQASEVAKFDAALARLAEVVEKELAISIHSLPGAGAAGGLGAGLRAFLDAQIRPGAVWMAEMVDLEAKIRQSSAVITGEGRFDGQTGYGKTLSLVIEAALRWQKPLWILAGSLGDGWQKVLREGHVEVVDTSEGAPELPSPEEAKRRLYRATRKVAQKLRQIQRW